MARYHLSDCAKLVAKDEEDKEDKENNIITIYTFPQLQEVVSFLIGEIYLNKKKIHWNKDSTEIYIILYSVDEEEHEKTYIHKFNLATHELIYVKDFEKYLDEATLDPNFKKICWTDFKTKSFSLLNIEEDLLYNYDYHHGADNSRFKKPLFDSYGNNLLILSEDYVHIFDVKDCTLVLVNRITKMGSMHNKVLNYAWTNESQIIILEEDSCKLYNKEGYLTKVINPYLVDHNTSYYLSISPCNEMVVFATKGMIHICNINNPEEQSKILCRFTSYFNCARFEFMGIDFCMSNIFWSSNSKIIGFLCSTQRNMDLCKIVIYDIERKAIIFFENYVSFFGYILFMRNNFIFFKGLDNNIHSLIHNKNLINTLLSFSYSTKGKPEDFKPVLHRDILRKVCEYFCDTNEEISDENIHFQFSKNRNPFRIWI